MLHAAYRIPGFLGSCWRGLARPRALLLNLTALIGLWSTAVAVDTPPTVATPASASPSPVTGRSTVINVLGADDGGEANLIYTWAAVGSPPAPVIFAANASHAARHTTATFSVLGNYTLQCTIRDVLNQSVTSSVSLSVVPTLTSLTLTPTVVRLNPGASQQFNASAKDQFGAALAPQPTLSWSVDAGGTISTAGIFTAGATPGGPFTVTVVAGSKSRTAAVTINAPPTVATPASISANPVTGTTATLSVLGADDLAESALTYTWATVGTPPASVTFLPNKTNAAKNAVATFHKAGDYTIACTVRDQGGLTATSTLTCTVVQTATTLVMSPATVRLNPSTTKTFTAIVKDQFALALTSQPTLTWSTSGGGVIASTGVFTASATPGGPYTITATTPAGLSGTATVTINAPPTVATAAAASPSPVTGTTTALSVLGADDLGEAALKYSWSTTGTVPAPVTFAPNGTNAAKAATATFTKIGSYTLKCTISDAGGLKVTSSVTVSVQATATRIAVTPLSTSILVGSSQSFTASVLNQFDAPLAPQPTTTWTVSGGGTISAAGVFTAGATPGGPFIVTATAGSLTGTASITITSTAPTIATPASAAPNPVTGTTTTVSVLGADSQGEANLTYTWLATGSPPAAITVTPNGTNAAKNATVTFVAAGSYVLQCTIANGSGNTATTSVAVTVTPTLTAIAVSPTSATIGITATQAFTGSASDQFGASLAPQPTVTWTVTGTGTIDGAGLFTPSPTAGGPYTVSATASSISGTASVSVTDAPPTVATAATASANPVTTTSVGLNVLGADDGGEPTLTYTWSTTGTPPAPVVFTPNGTNDAKATTATLGAAGSYTFRCTITDASNLTVTSSLTLAVTAVPTTVMVSPTSATSELNGTTAVFTATVQDQFGGLIASPPTVVWSAPSAAGTIDATGQLTAAATSGGPYTVTATCQGASGTAQVTIVDGPPTVADPALANADPSGVAVSLIVLGADDGGEANLTYTWSTIGTSPASVTFSSNGTNAAKATSAFLTTAGTYTFQVAITDGAHQTVTSQVTVSVGSVAPALIWTYAGNGSPGSSGDGGPATAAALNQPNDIAIDDQGNLFIAGNSDMRVRRVDAATGIITTVAGTGIEGSDGDGGPATAAKLDIPASVAVDHSGHLYIAEFFGCRIRKVDLVSGIITTVAGTGSRGFSGDGGAALSAQLSYINGIALDASANLYLTDYGNNRIRRVDASTGIITTIAGTGAFGYSGDGGPATAATINVPSGIRVDAAGNVLFSEYSNNCIRKITQSTGFISTAAGTTAAGHSGDGGPATLATINGPNGLGVDSAGNLYIGEYQGQWVRRVDANGTITTIAGTGSAGFSGDGGPGTSAMVYGASGIAVDAQGRVFITDRLNHRIRVLTTGPLITTAANASPNPVTGTTTALNVLGTCSAGESTLSYTWSAAGTPPAAVSFSPNGTHAAQNTTATFAAAGTYLLRAVVADAYGRTAVSSVVVSVVPTYSGSFAVQPANATIPPNGSQAFTVINNLDQFGNPSTAQPMWSVSGGGTIAANGLFTAGSNPGSATVTATIGSRSATATVSIVNQPPTIATAASASPNPATTTTALSVLGADDGGEAALTYTWATIGTPPASVTFSANGTNAAKRVTATFTSAGSYTIQCTIMDTGSLTVTSSVSVTVSQTLTRITVTPTTTSVAMNGTQSFTATALDQFSQALAPQPTFAWTASGGGTISTAGVFTAGTTAGGPFTITASSGGMNGTSSITVANAPPTVATAATAVVDPAGIAVSLQVLGASDGGESQLTYTWSTTGASPPSATFTPNGTNAAKATTAFLTAPGTYTFQVAITDAFQQTVTSQVTAVIPSVSPALIGTYAGSSMRGAGGDNGPAIGAAISNVNDVAVDDQGNVFIAGNTSNRVRRVDAATGIITTVAGTGDSSSGGDGGPATAASLYLPASVAIDHAGHLYIAEFYGCRIRCVDLTTGIITTVAGNGYFGFVGDGGPATSAHLLYPNGVAVDASGNLSISDYGNNRIRRVDVSSGIITTIAGTGSAGYSGDGGLATAATMNAPTGIRVDAAGNVLFSEYYNHCIRKITQATGIISTLAGTGVPGFSGDGGPATQATINAPNGLGVDSAGNVYIGEYQGQRVRRVDANGIITTIAGNGVPGLTGDGGPATAAQLYGCSGIAVDATGRVFIADNTNIVVRVVTTGPLVVTPASVSSNPVTGTTATVNVLGACSAGESTLAYTWSTIGTPPGAVTFSINGSHAAQTTVATFSAAGTYALRAVISDGYGRTAVSPVFVTVVQTPAQMSLVPGAASVYLNGSQQFTPSGTDQFNAPLLPTAPLTWSVSGGGSISSSGLFTPAPLPGNYTVTATGGAVSATARITVVNAAPTVANAASSNANPVTGVATTLSVLGADDGGENNLTYRWAVVGTPPGPVVFGVDLYLLSGTNAGKMSWAKFAKAGTYTLQALITDQFGLSVTSSVVVTVVPAFTKLSLTPNPFYANPGSDRAITATALDQFGLPVSPQPSITSWSVTGGGTISSTGVFSASPTPGGPFLATATSGSIAGTCNVYVQAMAPVANSQSVVASIGVARPITLVASDANADPLTFALQSQPTHGTLSGTAPNLIYTPTAGYLGSDQFTFTASDGTLTSAVATVAISVVQYLTPEDPSQTPLVLPPAFDAARWTGDAAYRSDYLTQVVPGRVWQSAEGAVGVPTLAAVGSRNIDTEAGFAQALSVIGLPNAPVTFLCTGASTFADNGQTSITVVADSQGIATAAARTPDPGRSTVLAASPMAVGRVRFTLHAKYFPPMYLIISGQGQGVVPTSIYVSNELAGYSAVIYQELPGQ